MTTRTLTALFESRDAAERAVNELVQDLGMSRANISLVAQEATTSTTSAAASQQEPGFWGSLKEMFMPDEDRATYAEGVSRGGVMISVQADDAQIERAELVLERNGAVDLDEREAQWRQEGWTGAAAGAATGAVVGTVSDGTQTGVAAMPVSATTSSTSANPPGTMLSRGVDQVAGTNVSGAHPENESGRAVSGVAGATATQGQGEEAIPVVEERLTVGKREVGRGRVRVRSYIVETPVQEQVSLHQENVEVQRRTVDRPATDAERLFEDRTIEAVETREEAVVAKEARIKEELVIRKSAEDRVETVHDTVRHTEVTVDDDRKTAASTTTPTTAVPVTPSRDRV